MSEVMHSIGEEIIIRFDGLDADDHVIDLSLLADSLKGFSRIIAVAGNFAATEKFIQHKDAMAVRVVAKPPEAHCFEVSALLQWVSQNALAATFVGGIAVTLVSYIFRRLAGDKAEMKELRAALETAIKENGNRDQRVIDRLLDTVDRLADTLRPAAKQALSPIGKSAATVSVFEKGQRATAKPFGAAEKDAIESEAETEVLDETVYSVTFHEMNMDNVSCKVSLSDDDEGRINAIITDPVATLPNNAYATAFASRSSITVKAKATVQDGAISKLFISDTVKS